MDDKIVRFPDRNSTDDDEIRGAIKYYGAIASEHGGFTLYIELYNGETKFLQMDSARELRAIISTMNSSQFLYYNEDNDTLHAYNRRDRVKWPD